MKTAALILNAVSRWADTQGYWLLRETCALAGGRRFDGVLVPVRLNAACMKAQGNQETVFFDRPRIAIIEVKTTRADFLAGVGRGQFEDYRQFADGMYLACPRSVARRTELPSGVGLLLWSPGRTMMGGGDRLRCARHPVLNPKPEWAADVPWRLMFKLAEDYHRRINIAVHQD